jgi:transcriptional regulator with XRE-family HTH domain
MTADQARANIRANLARFVDSDQVWAENKQQGKIGIRELARLTGDCPQTISRIVNGKSCPTAALLFRIASALGVTIDELMEFSCRGSGVIEPTGPLPENFL